MTTPPDIEDMTDAQDDAPERIWLEPGVTRQSGSYPPRLTWPDHPKAVGYVRADLARPSQAGDERVAEGIAIALWREEAAPGTPSVQKLRNADTWADQAPELRDRWIRFARAALAAMDTPKGGGDE